MTGDRRTISRPDADKEGAIRWLTDIAAIDLRADPRLRRWGGGLEAAALRAHNDVDALVEACFPDGGKWTPEAMARLAEACAKVALAGLGLAAWSLDGGVDALVPQMVARADALAGRYAQPDKAAESGKV